MSVTDAPTSFAGSMVDRLYGTTFADLTVELLEHVPDLRFPLSVRTFRQMATYPQLKGVLGSYVLPVRKADWRVDPAGCRPVVAQLVADDLGLPLLGSDPQPGPARRRGVRFDQVLRLAVPGHLTYGFYPFEKRFDIVGGQARLAELAERVPGSINEISVGKDGALSKIRQDHHLATEQGITGDRLVWFCHEKEGANWVGRSLLRPAYGAWLIAQEMWRVNATSKRRTGMGVPGAQAEPGTNPTPAQMAEAQRVATSYRVGEDAGYTMPPGFRLVLTGVTGSVPDPLEFIRYLDQQMSTMALSGVLDLGSTPNGSRALGDVFVDLLHEAVQSVGDNLADEATRALSVPLTDFNFGEDEPAPRIVCGDVGAKREITAESLNQLLTSGALSADPGLEAYIRSRYGLPEPDPDAPSPAPGAPAARARSGRRGRVAAAQGALRRQPSQVEVAAATDFEAVQAQWETALDKLVDDWSDIGAAQREQLLEQVRAAVAAGDVEALTGLSVDTGEAATLLAAAMAAVATQAASEQAEEAGAQDVDVEPGEPDEERMSAVATTIAALMGSGLAGAAARKALQAWTPQATPDTVTSTVAEHLESLTDASLRDQLGAGLSTAQNEGRIATLQQAPQAAAYLASEILDKATCKNCQGIDGHRFDSLAEAEAAYANGGYSECQGGLRCRGIIVTVWDESALEDAA